MIKLIYGAKGTGKTKIAIDSANKSAKETKGLVVFVTDTNRGMFDLDYQVRLINTQEYNVSGVEVLRGFLKGVVAANTDNQHIYLDGVSRITNKPLDELEEFFTTMEKLGNEHNVEFVITCSAAREDLPKYLEKYL